jgi:hypothetical protein
MARRNDSTSWGPGARSRFEDDGNDTIVQIGLQTSSAVEKPCESLRADRECRKGERGEAASPV